MKNALIRLLFILDSGEKKKTFILTILVLVNVIFEMLGIGLLIPFLTLLTDSGTNSLYFEKISYYFPFIEGFNKNDLIFLSLASIFIIYLSKTIFLVINQFSSGVKKIPLSGIHKYDLPKETDDIPRIIINVRNMIFFILLF